MLSIDDIKKQAGVYAATYVQPGMTIGLGTGSTVYWLIQEFGKKVKRGMDIKIVPTSKQTAELAKEAGIEVTDLDSIDRLPLTIDGADEIDPKGWLIKGGGGALLQEKIVAAASDKLVIIVDHKKMVKQLGKFPLPVEVIPFGYKQVIEQIRDTEFCHDIKLREKEGKPFITDHNHYILDCFFETINYPMAINYELRRITGVVDTGLFIEMADEAVIGLEDGTVKILNF